MRTVVRVCGCDRLRECRENGEGEWYKKGQYCFHFEDELGIHQADEGRVGVNDLVDDYLVDEEAVAGLRCLSWTESEACDAA